MSITAEPTQIDTDKLMSFVYRAVDEVGATLNAALVVMGDKLGYYRDLAEHGPTTPARASRRRDGRPAVPWRSPGSPPSRTPTQSWRAPGKRTEPSWDRSLPPRAS